MSITANETILRLADRLAEAEQRRQGVQPLSAQVPGLTLSDAYRVQMVTIDRKVANGASIVGKKIGLTSKAMQNMFGVDTPDVGHLLDEMQVANGGAISARRVLQPRVEAEIAFVLERDLVGPQVTPLDVLLATEYVVPALEIVDSRVADWKITLTDTVADNASSGLFVLGEQQFRVEEVDLELVGMVLSRNGEIVNTGVGAACLGHPANCVAWLANQMHAFGTALRAGEVILSGAMSAAVPAVAGDHFTARFAHLGQVDVHFTA